MLRPITVPTPFSALFTLSCCRSRSKPCRQQRRVPSEGYTPWFQEFVSDLAVSHNINIIAGSHPTKDEAGELKNVTYVCLRDGSVHAQEKIHPTPNEAYWWNMKGGSKLDAINTDCGPIGVLICYDAEFPELARHLIDQGAMILFVPFCTDEQRGYLRVAISATRGTRTRLRRASSSRQSAGMG